MKKKRKNKGFFKNVKPQEKIVLAVIFLLIVIITAVFVYNTLNKQTIEGVWVYNDYTKYEFKENGNGCLYVDEEKYDYKYLIENDMLKIDFKDSFIQDCEYKFSVEKKQLTLIGGKGTDKGTYQLTLLNN